MPISNETFKSMIRDYGGEELSDEELSIVRLEVDTYMAEIEKLKELNLSDVPSARLLRVWEGNVTK